MKLNVQNISVDHGEIKIIDKVSFNLDTGDVLGLIGPNGSGKSTLMNALIGTIPKTGNSNLVIEQDSTDQNDFLTFGYVPEQPVLYGYMTVVENFKTTSITKGLYKNDEEIFRLINILELNRLSTRKARSLSQGEKKRLAIGLALVGNPDVLIFDEPHNGLDNDGISILRAILKAKAKDHIIILCSHYFFEIESHCNQILALQNGKVVCNDSTKSILDQYHSVEKLFNSLITCNTHEKNFTF